MANFNFPNQLVDNLENNELLLGWGLDLDLLDTMKGHLCIYKPIVN